MYVSPTKLRIMKKRIFYILILMCISYTIKAQNSSVESDSITNVVQRKLELKAKNTGKKIILRWAPDSPGAWHVSNTKGYMIERLAYKDSANLFDTGYQLITPDTLKPWALDKWEPIANEASGDKYAAIAAQAIHGKRNLSAPENKDANFLQKANELNNLYAFALLAAEFSRNAALASGLRYEDTNIDPSMNYVYRVHSNAATEYYHIDTAYVMLKGNEITQSIVPEIAEVEETEKFITLKWDRAYNEDFSAWYIEKSSDEGKTFQQLNKDPYMHSVKKDQNAAYIMYRDSVTELYKKHQYRIIGINTFAELSTPSKAVIAMGRDKTPPPTPFNVIAEQVNENNLKITWDTEVVPDLKGFYITKSSGIGSKEELITKNLLSIDTRSYTDLDYNQLNNNWYQIYAIDTVGNAIVSYPTYGSVRDDFAPQKPENMQGKIDTLGIVKLDWSLGKEKDLFGYHVYMANADEHVYSRLTSQPVRDTIFTDTITLKVLTEEIFYKIKAVDIKGNVSEFSETLPLKKPDIIPPSAPVFNDYNVLKNGIQLSWAPSISNDIQTHYLYRKEIKAKDWELIYRTDLFKDQDRYLDNTTEVGKTYTYKLTAEDDDGLQTDGVYIVTLTAIDFSTLIPVKNLNITLNKEQKQAVLKWTYPKKGALLFIIFRAVNGGGFNIIKTLDSDKTQYVDKNIKPNTNYEYTIQVQYSEQKKSGFSPIKKITL